MWSRLSENCHYAWAYLWSGRTFAIVLGVLFALVAVALLIASRTRWGQAKPITKCIVVSVLAHIWLLLYASGRPLILPQGDPRGAMQSVAVSLDASRLEPAGPAAALLESTADSAAESADVAATDARSAQPAAPPQLAPWEQPAANDLLARPDLFAGAPQHVDEFADPTDELSNLLPEPLPTADLANRQPELFEPAPLPELPAEPAPVQSPAPELADSQPAPEPSPQPTPLPMLTPTLAPSQLVLPPASGPSLQTVSSQRRAVDPATLPVEYQLRQAADRLELARPFGADQDTEAAVAAALSWLARAQSSDGTWIAKQFGAGTETYALGEDRRGTGDRADTGVTGLALLAFLSGGHTHLDGQYQMVVQRGLESLLRAQMPSGDLSGKKQIGNDASVTNARMYCHGIATLALAEAYALTHDAAIREALVRAVQYTLAAQDPRGGGWRYRPGDAGDLSQFGWQAMALRSAERSGLRIEPIVKQRMAAFLGSCATGASGGLARYRPYEGAPSATMTAEALACRLLLNFRGSAQAQGEARDALMANLPGSSQENVYYWYYATLALFQLQDESWQRWNVAMKTQLLRTQKPAYDENGGSWDPDPLWGGYGGRVYSTAMSCMCLEVYYRYLPLYK